MNAFASECSSGCESGWTLYLEHSFLNQNRFIDGTDGFYEEHKDKRVKDENSGDEEDLSMVSDASSGPPHIPDDEACFNEEHNNGCFYSAPKAVKLAKSGTKRLKVKENQHRENQHLPSFLHDTASSHVFDISTNDVTGTNRQTSTGSMLNYSQGFSANYFEGRSSFQEEHFGLLQPSLSKNELQGNKWYGGKKWR
ncbi:protein SOB FIVE-LIKE 5-like [Gastrolobium bilobum]|uniref:protein SOB FIVE-LIKE 5-like n=1 Tax=Gastrolobium bilobum TaxID=150636 RepID=UPI002AB29CC7|nr:protein SOB FIVE-LIKE 5-like [Gastrolobium bilobum]